MTFRVGLSLGILISLCFIATSALFVPTVEAVKSRPIHSIRDVIFPILKDHSARHYCYACGILVLIYSASFLFCGSSIPHLNTVESPLGYEACF
jgi:hypothetical protein